MKRSPNHKPAQVIPLTLLATPVTPAVKPIIPPTAAIGPVLSTFRPLAATVAVLIIAFLAGCAAVGPDYVRPSTPVSPAWSSPLHGGLAVSADSQDLAAWWTTLADPELSRLIERAAAGNLDGAAAAFGRALALEPAFAGARLGLARAHAAAGRRERACSALEALLAPDGAEPRGAYQRLLVSFDRPAAEKFKEELCRKKTTGGATASPPRKR